MCYKWLNILNCTSRNEAANNYNYKRDQHNSMSIYLLNVTCDSSQIYSILDVAFRTFVGYGYRRLTLPSSWEAFSLPVPLLSYHLVLHKFIWIGFLSFHFSCPTFSCFKHYFPQHRSQRSEYASLLISSSRGACLSFSRISIPSLLCTTLSGD